MGRLLRTALPVLLMAAVVLGAGALARTALAAAGTLGTLKLTPASGTDLDAFSVTTVSSGGTPGCPTGTSNVTGLITGPGGWATPQVAFANTSAGISTSAEFSVPMANSMKVLAANYALTIVPGDYTITMTCQNAIGTTKYGTFAVTFTWTTATSYTSPGATTPTPTPTPSPTPSVTASASPSAGASASASVSPSPSVSPSATASPSPSAGPSTGATLPNLGSLVVDPATGSDLTGIQVTTASTGTVKGCPAGTSNVSGRLTGPGGWAAGIVAFTNTASGVSTSAEFSVPLANSFAVLAANNSLTVLAGRYDIVMTCQNAIGTSRFGTFTGSLYFTDATHYQSKDPATSQTEASVVVEVTPLHRSELGQAISLKATVQPASAAGTVQFRDGANNAVTPLGTSASVQSGSATLSISTLGFGLHRLSAVFTPTTATAYTRATAVEVVYVVAKPLPPLPTKGATVSGTVKVASTLTCSAAFANATSTSFRWLRDRVGIAGATSATYRPTSADRGKPLQCQMAATNAGGTTRRTSAAVVVP